MRQTLREMRINDMVTIDAIVFEIVGDKAPPPRIVNFVTYPVSVGLHQIVIHM